MQNDHPLFCPNSSSYMITLSTIPASFSNFGLMILQRYIEKQSQPFEVLYRFGPVETADMMVVIPCYNEPDLIPSLRSLFQCQRPQCGVAVIIVVNSADNAPAEAIARNKLTIEAVARWTGETSPWFAVELLHAAHLPHKWAGVGWARKIGFDRALWHFTHAAKADGWLVAFDADSTTLPNFLTEVEKAFISQPKAHFFTIHFEHPLGETLPPHLLDGIIRYELHLRYLRLAMAWCGYPHSIHTVGSSMAVKASAYAMQGGMNRRKAGEDFYFLHKLVLLGHYGNINTTTIIPASRVSDRVPFGTRAAVRKWDNGGDDLLFSYSLESFALLKPFLEMAPSFYRLDKAAIRERLNQLHHAVRDYILQGDTPDIITTLSLNCSDATVFERRLFHQINAFWIIRYLNTMAESAFPKRDVENEAHQLLSCCGYETSGTGHPLDLLNRYRQLDRQLGY